MKTVLALSVAAVMAMSSSAFAGGLFASVPVLSPNIGISTGNLNLLNGNVVAVGNGSTILSGIGNNVGVLTGIGNITNSGLSLGILGVKKGH